MKKLSGGSRLSCGHQQVLSPYRIKLATAGLEQNPVWCLECDDWTNVQPTHVPVNEQENETLE